MKADFLFTAIHCISRMEKDVFHSAYNLTADRPLKINPPTNQCVFIRFSSELNLQWVQVLIMLCSNTHGDVKMKSSIF